MCWCDGKVASHGSVTIDGDGHRGAYHASVNMNFCPTCGRDLRLPVARWWTELQSPPSGWYFARSAVDGSIPRIVKCDSDKSEFFWSIVPPGREWFGPVTVSPAEPEGVPE